MIRNAKIKKKTTHVTDKHQLFIILVRVKSLILWGKSTIFDYYIACYNEIH